VPKKQFIDTHLSKQLENLTKKLVTETLQICYFQKTKVSAKQLLGQYHVTKWKLTQVKSLQARKNLNQLHSLLYSNSISLAMSITKQKLKPQIKNIKLLISLYECRDKWQTRCWLQQQPPQGFVLYFQSWIVLLLSRNRFISVEKQPTSIQTLAPEQHLLLLIVHCPFAS